MMQRFGKGTFKKEPGRISEQGQALHFRSPARKDLALQGRLEKRESEEVLALWGDWGKISRLLDKRPQEKNARKEHQRGKKTYVWGIP